MSLALLPRSPAPTGRTERGRRLLSADNLPRSPLTAAALAAKGSSGRSADHVSGRPGAAPVRRRARLARRGRRAGHPGACRGSGNQKSGRLPCPGPWWEATERGQSMVRKASSKNELAGLEFRRLEADGHRVRVQRLAREQLTAEGTVLTRPSVARRACALLGQPTGSRAS